MNNRQVALKLFLEQLDVDTTIDTRDDRKRVQKAVYLGQLTGVDLGYRFGWYLMGPYSSDLTRDYYAMAEEKKAGDRAYEGKQLHGGYVRRLERIKPFLNAREGLDQSTWLELIASYHYLRSVSKQSKQEAKKTFESQKPSLLAHFELADDVYKKMSLGCTDTVTS